MRTMVLAAMLVAGCSARSAPPPLPPDAAPRRAGPVIQPIAAPATGFAGRWNGAGSLTTKCGADPQSVDQDELDVVITRAGSKLTVVRDTCTYAFDVRGRTATARPGQRCADATIDAWTLTLGENDAELTAAFTARTEAAPGIACTSRLKGVLTRR